MRPLRSLVLATPILASLAVPCAVPAEAHPRHDGAALAAGLIGLGLGAVAGSALAAHPDGYGPVYAEPRYVPPPVYGYAPAYVAPPVVYAPPPVVYAPPPPVAYVPPPVVVYAPAPRPLYAVPRVYAAPRYVPAPAYAGWGDD